MRRLGAVIVYITEMTIAAPADDVHPLRFLGKIDAGTDILFGDRSPKTRKAAFAVKFGLGTKHRVGAAHAAVEAGIVQLKIAAVVGQIAARFACDIELL